MKSDFSEFMEDVAAADYLLFRVEEISVLPAVSVRRRVRTGSDLTFLPGRESPLTM